MLFVSVSNLYRARYKKKQLYVFLLDASDVHLQHVIKTFHVKKKRRFKVYNWLQNKFKINVIKISGVR